MNSGKLEVSDLQIKHLAPMIRKVNNLRELRV